jgi:hypothetical protein
MNHRNAQRGIRVHSGGSSAVSSSAVGGSEWRRRFWQRAAETVFRAKLAIGDTVGTLGERYHHWKERVSLAADAFRVHLAAQEQGYRLLLQNIPESELPLLAYEIVPLVDLLPDTETVRIRDWELPAHALFLAIGETATSLHAFPFYLIEHHDALQQRYQSGPQNRSRLLGILPLPDPPVPLVASEPQAHYTCAVPDTGVSTGDTANEPRWQPYNPSGDHAGTNPPHRLGPPETEAALLRRLQQLYPPAPHTAHL